MRIDELQLIAYGPFTGTVLDLSGGCQGFHIIYGPNEAGKSSALRGLRDLLYGIPARSADNFVHPHSKMRIGATLRNGNGNDNGNGDRLSFIRRKGRNHTIRETDDKSVVEESRLRRFLSGVDGDLFATMFGIGYEDLVRGGQEIIKGGGDLGQLVFSAGSGIVNLLEIQKELQTEADRFFKPAGQKPVINEALRQLKQNRADLKASQLKGQDWFDHDKTLQEARSQKHKVQEKLNLLSKNLSRLQRIKQALPVIAERRELDNDYREYAEAVILPAQFSEQRRQLLLKAHTAENQKQQYLNNIDSYRKAIDDLSIRQSLLDNGEVVETIHQELGSRNKDLKDRGKLEANKSALLSEAGEIFKNLGYHQSLVEAEKLRIPKPEELKIQKLGVEYEKTITRIESAREKLPEIDQAMEQIRQDLNALTEPFCIYALQAALGQAQEYGPQEKLVHTGQVELESALKTIQLGQKKLGLKDLTLEELESLPAPEIDVIGDYQQRFDKNLRRTEDIRKAIGKSKDALLVNRKQMETSRLQQDVPTEEDLLSARALRNEGWKLIVQTLNKETVNQGLVDNYIAGTPDAVTLADAFEANLNHTDLISDRLRREADQVAQKAILLAEQKNHELQLLQLEKDLSDAQSDNHRLTQDWESLCQEAGVRQKWPKQMGQWVRDFDNLVEKAGEYRIREAKINALAGQIEAHRIKLIQCLNTIENGSGEIGSGNERDGLTVLIKKAQSIISAEQERQRRREQLLRDQSKLQNQMKTAQSKLASSEKDLELWRLQWQQAVNKIGLGADTTPDQANAVMAELKSLFEKLKQAQILKKRIVRIDHDMSLFDEKVSTLVDVVAPDLANHPAAGAASELYHRLKHARDAWTKKETLEKQLSQEQKRLGKVSQNAVDLQARLTQMCKDAGCETPEQLPDVEQRSSMRCEIESRLESTGEQLRRLSGGAAIEAFIQQALEVDPDGILAQIRQLEESIEELNTKKSHLDQTIGSERTELEKMDGSAKAAVLAEQGQIIMGGIENSVEQYARFKIASRVLNMAIERYRDKSQGPVMKRASVLFHEITCGQFEGVRAEYDNKGLPVIVGIRKCGDLVHVQAMSDGTADQLFLALRIAALELYLDKNEPMPFIVDDILIKFDNERSGATLRTLAALSQKTQLIFFTHHHHLVKLAQKHIDSSMLFQYQL
ncbi:MAG: AAA family ATPase [Desulfobacteraceae bacterium]|nr:AAA family ATPase [Desulfobacteraceae bacterium]